MAAVLRSLFYLVGFGGVGYVLLKITSQDDTAELKKYSENKDIYKSESLKTRQAFVDVLRLAAEGKDPMYRQTKEEIDAARNKFSEKKQ